jgi:hypothetical protein
MRLKEHLKTQRAIDPTVGVGSAFRPGLTEGSVVVPALYVYLSEVDMKRISLPLNEFEGMPVIYRVGEARISGTKAGQW